MGNSARLIQVPIAGFEAAVHFHKGHDRAVGTIVALHGFTGSGEDYLPLREALGDDRFHWACVDFMGHGQSDSPSTLDPYLLGNALRLVDFARGLAPDPDKVFLLAYSMGARVALHYLKWAEQVPAALIGASPGIEDAEERGRRRISDAAWIDPVTTTISCFCERWEDQPLIQPQTRLPQPLRAHLAARRRGNTIVGLWNSLLALGSGVLPSLWDQLADIPPTLCLFGEEDEKYARIARLMESRNPRLTALKVPGCGHSPHLEAPKAVATLLSNLLLSR